MVACFGMLFFDPVGDQNRSGDVEHGYRTVPHADPDHRTVAAAEG